MGRTIFRSLIEITVKKMTAKKLGIDITEINDDTFFYSKMGSPVLNTLSRKIAIEKKFEIEVPFEIAEKLNTVEKAVNYLLKCLPEQYKGWE
jgi:acyl carrier protein